MGEFSPPLFLNHADAQTSNTATRLWFYYIITKIHPPFQNPGSAPDLPLEDKCNLKNTTEKKIQVKVNEFNSQNTGAQNLYKPIERVWKFFKQISDS